MFEDLTVGDRIAYILIKYGVAALLWLVTIGSVFLVVKWSWRSIKRKIKKNGVGEVVDRKEVK